MAAPALELTAARRQTGTRQRVALAIVEPGGSRGGRRSFTLHAAPIGSNVGVLEPGAFSFLAVEDFEGLPLRATRALQTHESLSIEAETSSHDRLLELTPTLVVLHDDAEETTAPRAEVGARGGINYLTRDFTAFRGLILDRITALAPSWTDRTSADVGVMLADVLAYLADGLAYEQDAVATEAYLTTARRRVSVRRHARLLGYFLDQGVSARVWVQFQARERLTIPHGTQLLAGPLGHAVVERGSAAYEQQRAHSAAVFETLELLELRPELAEMEIWDQGQRHFSVAAGATSVELRGDVLFAGERRSIDALRAGEVVLFSPAPGGDQPPHPVRITSLEHLRRDGASLVRLGWSRADAPLRELAVTRTDAGVTRQNLTLVSGNVVLADFGETRHQRLPTRRSLELPYTAELPAGSIVSAARRPPRTGEPAAAVSQAHDDEVRPAIELRELTDLEWLAGVRGAATQVHGSLDVPLGQWLPVPDRLASTPFSPVFVAEAQGEGWSLSFGDGVFGRGVPLGAAFEATYRAGETSQSHVGAGALVCVVAASKHWESWSLAGLSVSNPLPAFGGRGEETLEHARRTAPASSQQVNAAVTLADYATIARTVEGVADVAARLCWTGSWFTTFVHVRVSRDARVPSAVLEAVERALAEARLAGRDVAVRAPEWVPLSVVLKVQIASGFSVEEVRAELRAAFVAPPSRERAAGFFDPSRWSFGEAVVASAVVAWASGVRGVAFVELSRLARVPQAWGAASESADIVLDRAELPQLLDAPFHPETGSLEFDFVVPREGSGP